ncbi:3'-5' exonuclease [Aquibacillus kalidii]|uniref:3'-5' exonuclease n=1 Tax=Aquibacillus kalidii TaxID=2762597 RepID=UPI001646D67B|nr:exonuclease domain-containing protein [Aquibacillus kalidii]
MLPIDLQILKYFFFEKPIYRYKMQPFFQWDSYFTLKSYMDTIAKDQIIDQNLDEITYTVFDLETTGLIPEIGHEIISIGAIQLKGWNQCSTKTFYQTIKPIRPVSKRIHSLTGLSKNEIDRAPPFFEGFHKFLEFSQNSVLVAHPAKFDIRFLQTMLKRWKLPSYEPTVIDSQLLAKWLLPDINSQLDPLINFFGIKHMERHHALNDAKMTAELFISLLQLAKKQGIYSYLELKEALQPIETKNPLELIK